MENLIFSLNATVPIFLMMVLGMVFRKIGWMDVEFAEKMNKFVFLCSASGVAFRDLATVDFEEVWNIRFVIFCFIVTFTALRLCQVFHFYGKTGLFRESLSSHPIGAVRHCWELHLFRMFMEMQEWLR